MATAPTLPASSLTFRAGVLLAEVEACHGVKVAQAVQVYFRNLPSTVQASGDVGRVADASTSAMTRHGLLSWAEGLMDGLETFLRVNGADPLTALRVREYLWTYWADLAGIANA
jgi:hypothetical protein